MFGEVEIPTRLPVAALSVSSVNLFMRCPEKWRRRYLLNDYEPSSGAQMIGKCFGAAEAQSDHAQIDTGERLPSADVLDLFADEWSERMDSEEVIWGDDKPGELKDMGTRIVGAYDQVIAPTLQPVAVEREFMLAFEGVDWGFKGYIDLEEADGGVVDRKVVKRKISQADADHDPQVASYLLARRSEGSPAPEFRFHVAVKTKTPYAEVVTTKRTDRQLDTFVDRLYRVAAAIVWRIDTDNWEGAPPGAWWCASGQCGYWRTCPMGGAR